MIEIKTLCGIVATLLVALAFMNTAVAPPSVADPFADNMVVSPLPSPADSFSILGQADGIPAIFIPGESIVVEFSDNMLLPSLDSRPDLLIYFPPIPSGQYAEVQISSDNINWIPLGYLPDDFGVSPYPAPFPSERALIDIDFAALPAGTNYKYVKITQASPGFMIDAIEANPMHPVPSTGGSEEIPEFPTIALPMMAIIGLAFFMQHRKE